MTEFQFHAISIRLIPRNCQTKLLIQNLSKVLDEYRTYVIRNRDFERTFFLKYLFVIKGLTYSRYILYDRSKSNVHSLKPVRVRSPKCYSGSLPSIPHGVNISLQNRIPSVFHDKCGYWSFYKRNRMEKNISLLFLVFFFFW